MTEPLHPERALTVSCTVNVSHGGRCHAGIGEVSAPPPLRPAVEGGFSIDDFEISGDGTALTCPAVVP